MSASDAELFVSHTDLTYLTRDTWSFVEDYNRAAINLETQYPSNTDSHELALDIATIMASERSRRAAHYHRYRTQFEIPPESRLFRVTTGLAQASLLDLDQRVKNATDTQLAHAESMQGKGFSAELGHADQLGSWDIGGELDDQIRALPESEVLSTAGFHFAETYGDKNKAKISYKFHIASESEKVHPGAGKPVIKAVRKRAAADVTAADGEQYEIVKLSNFLINPTQLGRHYLQDIADIIELSSDKSTAKDALPVMDKAGHSIVEPFITHPEFREFSTGVLAVSSLYLALNRR